MYNSNMLIIINFMEMVSLKIHINNFSIYLFIYGRDKTFSALFLQVEAEMTQLRAFLCISLHKSLLVVALSKPELGKPGETSNYLFTWHQMCLCCHSDAVITHLHKTQKLEAWKCNCRKADGRTKNMKWTLDNF